MNTPSTCPHFSVCSGCTLEDHIAIPSWERAEIFFRSLKIEPKLHTKGFEKTRFKAKLAVRKGPAIGLFKKGSHELVSIPNCLVHHPSINEAAQIVLDYMQKQHVSGYFEKTAEGDLRYIQAFVQKETGKVQLSLVANEPSAILNLAKSLASESLFHSIWINEQKEKTNQIFSDNWKLISGDPFLFQKIYQKEIAYHPAAFSQVHLCLFEKMIEKIRSWLTGFENVLELYAGVGSIGVNLEDKVKSLTLVETNPFAYLSFLQMQSKASYKLMDAKDVDLSSFDLVIVDPPRKGLDASLTARIESNRLIYVSCDLNSFIRDATKLLELGWQLQKGEGYLFFPGTDHVEILALFERI